jgi:ribonucleoside-diphosphate reductase alpha chain
MSEQRPNRRRLPDERQSLTHRFNVGNYKGYITVGLYEDGMPGEIFILMAKEGTMISGLMDAFATAISMSLQYGVPLSVLVNKFSHMRFEPSGATNNPDIRVASSIVDYVFRWLGMRFLTDDEQQKAGIDRELGMQQMIDGGSALSEQIASAVKEAIEEEREEATSAPQAAAPKAAPASAPAPKKEPTTLAERIARNAGQLPDQK